MITSISAYHNGSKSARLLANALDCWILRKTNSRYVDRPSKAVINWGQTNKNHINTLNRSEHVSTVVDKLSFFRRYDKLFSHPEWTTDYNVACNWAVGGSKVVSRTLTNSHEGRGIHITDKHYEIVEAPLYTKYTPKKSEWRVHIVGSSVALVQRKVLKNGTENPNFEVRNTANGFVFQRHNIDIPGDVPHQALLAIRASNLDFGAVDVIWNEHHSKAYVLEINTAPGIEGTTVIDYATALKGLINAKFSH